MAAEDRVKWRGWYKEYLLHHNPYRVEAARTRHRGCNSRKTTLYQITHRALIMEVFLSLKGKKFFNFAINVMNPLISSQRHHWCVYIYMKFWDCNFGYDALFAKHIERDWIMSMYIVSILCQSCQLQYYCEVILLTCVFQFNIVLEQYHGPEDFTIKLILLLLCYSCVEFAIHVAMS